MIELDIKIRAKNHDNLKFLIEAMTDSLGCANAMGHVDVQFTAETDGDKMILTRKEIIIPSGPVVKTPIEDFIKGSDLSVRAINILRNLVNTLGNRDAPIIPFKYAEDITRERFLQCKNAGNRMWTQVEEELIKQNIKY